MTFLNPFAFIGLLALGIPIFVHLFGRRRARPQPFPSLRFLPQLRPNPRASHRPSDLLLLALRCLVIATAVTALAQPQWSTPGREREARLPVRVVILDTSASVQGSAGIVSTEARQLAGALVDSARSAILVESSRPGAELAGAASWLSSRSGSREVVIVSDFQVGSVVEGDLASLPDGIGLRLERVSAPAAGEGTPWDGVTMDARGGGTFATWPASSGSLPGSLEVSGGASDARVLSLVLEAARGASGIARRDSPPVRILFPGADAYDSLVRAAGPIAVRWQGDLLFALARDPVLAGVAAGARLRSCPAGTPLLRNDRDEAVAVVPGALENELLIVSCVAPSTLASTALVARTAALLARAPELAGREPTALPDEVLARWERPPVVAAPRAGDASSPDGRWLWLLALAWLGVESWLRRPAAPVSSREPVARHARVA